MPRNIITALDVGTSTVQAVVAERKKGENGLRILGIGVAPSSGLRKGMVIDMRDATVSIRKSFEEARKSSGVNVRSVWLALGGSPVSVSYSRGVVAVSRADGEISPEDVRRAVAAAGTFVPKNPNKEVLHMIPRDFRVDEEGGIKDPVGMHGVRLEADTLIIEYSALPLKNIFKCVESAGARIENYVFSTLAAAEAVLTKRQKELGVALLDLGGGTASFIIYEEGVPIHAGVVPIGGVHITNDLAIGLRTQVDVAERVKISCGSCLPGEVSRRDQVRLADFVEDLGREGDKEGAIYSRRELAEIIEARLRDIFELLQKELKKIGRAELLPAGAVLVGGSSGLRGLVDLTKRELKIPVEIGSPYEFLDALSQESAAAFAVSCGMLKWASAEVEGSTGRWGGRVSISRASPWVKWLKSLLP